MTAYSLLVPAIAGVVASVWTTGAQLPLVLGVVTILAQALLLAISEDHRSNRAPVLLVLAGINVLYFGALSIALIGGPHPSYDRVILSALGDHAAIDDVVVLLEQFSLCFCISAYIALGVTKKPVESHKSTRVALAAFPYAGRISLVIGAIYSVVAIATMVFRPAVMGGEAVTLPFRLSGILYYSKVLLIPYMCVCGVELARRSKNNSLLVSCVLFLFLNAITDSVLRASRGPVVWAAAILLFSYISEGRLPSKRLMLPVVGGLILAATLFPLVTNYRWFRVINNLDVVEAVSRVAEESKERSAVETLKDGTEQISRRLDGGSILFVVVSNNPEPLYSAAISIIREGGLASYLTNTAFGRRSSERVSIGPTFVGWLWLVGGRLLVLSAGLMLGLLCVQGWTAILHSRLHLTTAPCSLFLYCLLAMLADGGVEGLTVMIGISICVVALTEKCIPMIVGSGYSSFAAPDRRRSAKYI